MTNLLNNTPAMSLLYECINTVTQGMLDQPNLVKLSVSKLRLFIQDSDQNRQSPPFPPPTSSSSPSSFSSLLLLLFPRPPPPLPSHRSHLSHLSFVVKYLGLLALSRVLKDYPKLVAEHNDIILRCIEDQDLSIRMRALDLLAGMVNKKNLADIVKKLMAQIADGTLGGSDLFFRDDMVSRVIAVCSQGGYQFVTDFEWYIGVLIELCNVDGTKQGKSIAFQLLDVAIRVRVVREFAAARMLECMTSKALLARSTDPQISEVLSSAAWITGEFASSLEDPARAVEAFLHPSVRLLPGHIQALYVHNVLKVYSQIGDQETLRTVGKLLLERLPMFTSSTHLEVQERACTILEIMRLVKEQDFSPEIVQELIHLFEGELNPVAPKAQRKVPVPEDLDLDTWINEPLSDDEPERQDFSFLPKTSFGKEDDTYLREDPASSDDEEAKEAVSMPYSLSLSLSFFYIRSPRPFPSLLF